MKKSTRRENFLYIILFILAVILVFYFVNTGDNEIGYDLVEGDLEIYFLDVGQGDSILIKSPNEENILIDASTKSRGKDIVKKLKKLNVDTIHHMVGTHPHADHIGGLPEVIRELDVLKVYLPNKVNTTKIYEELLLEISNREIPLLEGKSGVNILTDGKYKLDILGPTKEYKDINNNSIVIKLTYNDFKAIFTGDAEILAERDLIEKGYNLRADLLKVGHHGSITSSSEEFLNSVRPDYGVISLGEDNKYNHPDEEIIKRFENLDIKVYRTDIDGDIVFRVGESIEIEKNLNL